MGGSLITDKLKPYTADLPTLKRLASEISVAWEEHLVGKLVIGHGSGSFGHTAGSQFHTREGVHTQEEWDGFVQVWQAARALNQIIIGELSSAGLPVIAFPPSACASADNCQIVSWNLEPIISALQAGLVPVVNGDVVFDRHQGGTIVSTEEVFTYLAETLHPDQILLAGTEPGVWAGFPERSRLIEHIAPENFPETRQHLTGSSAVDTTGGMLEKVASMVDLAAKFPGMEIRIFTGRKPGLLGNILMGEKGGTRIQAAAFPDRSNR